MTTPSASNKGLFAADLFRQISKTKSSENVIISPLSIHTALAITYLGAKGETAKELQAGLRLLVTDAEQVGRHFAGILRQNNGEAKLSIANKIFVNTVYHVAPFFKEIANKYFDSEAEQLDFSQSSKAINVINKWVEEKTNKKITNVMQPGSVNSDTKVIIVNAIYFKGKWKTPFSKDMTRKSNFWVSQTKAVKVDTIYGSEHFKYGEFPELNATAVEMPYKDSDISMILILPKERDGLADLESKLSSIAISDLSSKMTVKSLDLYMPRFKIEFTTRLTDDLKAMGMHSLFENAELPGMFESGPPVKVSDVHHKAFIEVNEAGSEAAAATILKITPMCLEFNKKSFNADHPFVFAIKNAETIYFEETIMTTPSASNKGLFAADLFRQISKTKSSENVIISPLSIHTALAITYLGAKGETAKELQAGLRLLVTDAEQVGRHFAGILRQNNGEAKLSIANKIFVNTVYHVAPFFKEIANKYFDSEAEQLDFSQSSKAINVINKWVEEKTNKKITKVMQPGSVNSDTKVIIVNAIYFKGKWKTPFSKDMTRKSNFWVSQTKAVKVDTIYGSEHFKYGEFPELNATAVEMPYKDSDISMILILPKERDGLADLESKLSSIAISDLSSKMTVKSLDLYMPRFKIEFTTRLTDDLKAMGMHSLFENAELPGMFESGPPVKVSDVHHKAFIEVN